MNCPLMMRKTTSKYELFLVSISFTSRISNTPSAAPGPPYYAVLRQLPSWLSSKSKAAARSSMRSGWPRRTRSMVLW